MKFSSLFRCILYEFLYININIMPIRVLENYKFLQYQTKIVTKYLKFSSIWFVFFFFSFAFFVFSNIENRNIGSLWKCFQKLFLKNSSMMFLNIFKKLKINKNNQNMFIENTIFSIFQNSKLCICLFILKIRKLLWRIVNNQRIRIPSTSLVSHLILELTTQFFLNVIKIK